MRCVKVNNEVDAWALIHRIEQKCELSHVFGDDEMTREEVYDVFMDDCSIYKFMSDNYSRVYAVAMIQRIDDTDEGMIHFSMFQSCHIKRGWKLLMDEIAGDINVLHSYITKERKDIYKLLVMLGFEMKTTSDGYYYGQSKKVGR